MFFFAAALLRGDTDAIPPSPSELPAQTQMRITGDHRTPHWFCFDVEELDDVRVFTTGGGDVLVRLFDARLARELSADVATDTRAAHFAVGRGEYALSIWSPRGESTYHVQRSVVPAALREKPQPIEFHAGSPAPAATIVTRPTQLLRGAAGRVGGTRHRIETTYRLTVPYGYEAIVTTVGEDVRIEARGDHRTALLRRGANTLAADRYLITVRGRPAAEAQYELRVQMTLKKIEIDRSTARRLEIDRNEVLVVGGNQPREAWLVFTVADKSFVRLRASRRGSAALMTVAHESGRHIATKVLDTTRGEVAQTLERGHYYIRVESDAGAAANVELRVFRFDSEAEFEARPKRKR